MRRAILWAAAVLFVAIGVIAWKTQAREKPNLLMITFDTTRADHIGAYGWKHARTPTIDKLATEATLFESAFATVPLTLPSHTAIMTGIYPFYSGVRDNSQFHVLPELNTLAERLQGQGYQTGATVAAFVLNSQFGLDQGFDNYDDEIPEREFERFQIPERNAQEVVDAAIEWLKKRDRSKPYFLWVHFYDAHHPYKTPPSFPAFRTHPYDLEIAFADSQLKRLMDFIEQTPPNPRKTAVVMTADHGEGLGEYGEETHGYFIYDGTVHVPLIIKTPDNAYAGKRVAAPVSHVDIVPTVLELLGMPAPKDGEIHGRSLTGLMRDDPAASDAFTRRALYFECFSPTYSFGWAPVRGVRQGQSKFIESPIPEFYALDKNPREGQENNDYDKMPAEAQAVSERLKTLLDAKLTQPKLNAEYRTFDAETAQKLLALGYLAGSFSEEHEWSPSQDLKTRLPLYNLILNAGEQIGGGNWESGVRMLLQALQQDPLNPRSLGLLSEAVANNPEQSAAGRALLEAATTNEAIPADMRAAFCVSCGRAYLIEQKTEKARDFFQRAVQLQDKNPVYLGWLAVAQLHLGQLPDALANTKKAAEVSSRADYLHVQLGLLEFISGHVAEGVAAWQPLLDRAEKPMSVWTIGGMLSNDPVIAGRAFEPLSRVAQEPTLPQKTRAAVVIGLSEILCNSGKYAEALTAVDAITPILPANDARAFWWRSRILQSLGRADEALDALRKAYASDATNMPVVADLANLLCARGAGAEAIQILEKLYAAQPDDYTAANNLAWTLAEYGNGKSDLDRALDLAKTANQSARSSGPFAHTLGWVCYKRKDSASAVFALARAVQIDPHNPEFQYHLGLAFVMDNNPNKAREAFEEAVKLAGSAAYPWLEDCKKRLSSDNVGAASKPEPQ